MATKTEVLDAAFAAHVTKLFDMACMNAGDGEPGDKSVSKFVIAYHRAEMILDAAKEKINVA